MITPYDWQEGIGNRAQYIEGKLEQGSPVLAVSLDAGILIYTRKRQSRKIYEVYDRLAYAAIGQQSDIEALRSAAVEFAHQEGYNHSEQDVTIKRVVTALSAPVKKAFSDFSSAPLVSKSLFVEINSDIADDQFYVLNFDGDYSTFDRYAAVTGTESGTEVAMKGLSEIATKSTPEEASKKLAKIWEEILDDEVLAEDLTPEVVLIERSTLREDRFRVLQAKA